MNARVEIHDEVLRRPTDGWTLCFQWCTYHYSEASAPAQQGYRFIWRRPNGSLQAGRAQARIPDADQMLDLMRNAHRPVGSKRRAESLRGKISRPAGADRPSGATGRVTPHAGGRGRPPAQRSTLGRSRGRTCSAGTSQAVHGHSPRLHGTCDPCLHFFGNPSLEDRRWVVDDSGGPRNAIASQFHNVDVPSGVGTRVL